MTAVNQLRGHGFAKQAIAAAMRAPLHKPVPKSDETAASHESYEATSTVPQSPTAIAEPTSSPEVRRMRAIAGWNQLATAIPNESMTPAHVRIPDNLVRAIEKSWHESIASSPEQEKGGNIIKNGGSGYDVRRYDGDANGDTFQPNDSDAGWRQSLVGMVHTHPYGEYKQEVPEGYASFSEQDFDAFMRSEALPPVWRWGSRE